MSIIYRNISEADYQQLRFDLIANVEGNEYQIYFDSATPAQATIGLGFNIQGNGDLRDATYVVFGVNGTTYEGELDSILNNTANYKSNSELRSALL